MSDGIKVKYVPEDFIVRESAAVRLAPPDSAEHRLYLLRKRGYTTFQAVRWISESLGIPESQVGYCGLKDEDGLTEQVISVPSDADDRMPGAQRTAVDGNRWMRCLPYGESAELLQLGQLEGNSFKIVLRNLERRCVEQGPLAAKKLHFYFLNYFDTQRFGVPGGPKVAHLVGGALLAERWAQARELLASSGSGEATAARDWTGADADFFTHLDGRVTSFFLAAHASHQWNRTLAEQVKKYRSDVREIEVEGVEFTYANGVGDCVGILAALHEIPITRYSMQDGVVRERQSVRASVVQTVVEIADRRPDEHFTGRMQAELSFFLPSGSYATAAVRQLTTLMS
ncbi:tRNA pseudouridine(13) synthase TruD [Streptomyces sp. NPDC090306]|uniref:tRNA pseudouridine(13) synthase TruD n=1 Tax=Streptomyces sp. NPDC090306 TaxID=3365961 RepID=UPI00380966EF